MATFRDLLTAAKAEIAEVTPEGAAEHIAGGYTVLDVREPDEYQEGALADAIHIPRGHLESQIEGRIPDKSTPVVVYCAHSWRVGPVGSARGNPFHSKQYSCAARRALAQSTDGFSSGR